MNNEVTLKFKLSIDEAELYIKWKEYLSYIKDERLRKVFALEHALRNHPLPKS